MLKNFYEMDDETYEKLAAQKSILIYQDVHVYYSLSSNEQYVLMVLMECMGPNNAIEAPIKIMAKHMKISKKVVTEVLNGLQEKGCIVLLNLDGKHDTVYMVNPKIATFENVDRDALCDMFWELTGSITDEKGNYIKSEIEQKWFVLNSEAEQKLSKFIMRKNSPSVQMMIDMLACGFPEEHIEPLLDILDDDAKRAEIDELFNNR